MQSKTTESKRKSAVVGFNCNRSCVKNYSVKLDIDPSLRGSVGGFLVLLTPLHHYISVNSTAADQLCDVAVI